MFPQNYVKHFLILAFAISGCVPIFPFASLGDIPVGITRFEVRLKVCVIIAAIKNYKSITKKREEL